MSTKKTNKHQTTTNKDNSIKQINLKAIQKIIDKSASEIIHTTPRCAIYNGVINEKTSQVEWIKSGIDGSLYLYKYSKNLSLSTEEEHKSSLTTNKTTSLTGLAFTVLNKSNDKAIKEDLADIGLSYHEPYILYKNNKSGDINGIWFSDCFTYTQTSKVFKENLNKQITDNLKIKNLRQKLIGSKIQTNGLDSGIQNGDEVDSRKKKKLPTKKMRNRTRTLSENKITAEIPINTAAVQQNKSSNKEKTKRTTTATANKQNKNLKLSELSTKPQPINLGNRKKSPSKREKEKLDQSPVKEVVSKTRDRSKTDVKVTGQKEKKKIKESNKGNKDKKASIEYVDPAILGMTSTKPDKKASIQTSTQITNLFQSLANSQSHSKSDRESSEELKKDRTNVLDDGFRLAVEQAFSTPVKVKKGQKVRDKSQSQVVIKTASSQPIQPVKSSEKKKKTSERERSRKKSSKSPDKNKIKENAFQIPVQEKLNFSEKSRSNSENSNHSSINELLLGLSVNSRQSQQKQQQSPTLLSSNDNKLLFSPNFFKEPANLHMQRARSEIKKSSVNHKINKREQPNHTSASLIKHKARSRSRSLKLLKSNSSRNHQDNDFESVFSKSFSRQSSQATNRNKIDISRQISIDLLKNSQPANEFNFQLKEQSRNSVSRSSSSDSESDSESNSDSTESESESENSSIVSNSDLEEENQSNSESEKSNFKEGDSDSDVNTSDHISDNDSNVYSSVSQNDRNKIRKVLIDALNDESDTRMLDMICGVVLGRMGMR